MPETKETTQSENLQPLNLDEEVQKYEAFAETTEVSLKKCKHKTVRYEKNAIICTCGASWTGSRLDELYKLLIQQD